MKLDEMIKEYKRILNENYTPEEYLELMIPYDIPVKVMNSVMSLICNQPERLSEKTVIDGSDSLNS